MKCRLKNNMHCDEDFQIEFDTLSELKGLSESLNSMIKYIELCETDDGEVPELIYRIDNHNHNHKTKIK
jgi:hypothetical protein